MPIIYSLSRKSVGGYAEVHVRFYNGRACDLRAKTRVYVPVNNWNADEGRCNISRRYETPENVKARAAQAELDELAQRITDGYAAAGGSVDKEWLQKLIDRESDEKPLYDIIEHYCDVKNLSTRTRYKLRALGKHLLLFEKSTRRKLYAHTITTQDLEALVRYFRSVSLGQNALASRMRQIRALVYFVGRPYPNPFNNFTMPQEVYADPFFLTEKERDAIATCDGLSIQLQAQRDIFVFQCHTGCRVSDLYSLTGANVKNGWLVYSPKKTERETGRIVELPLSSVALTLLERYKGVDLHGRLFPFVSEKQYNADIREILCSAGISRIVMWRDPSSGQTYPRPLFSVASSHLARRTFAQIAYARTGDKRLVASMTGHTENSKAFSRYSEVTRDMKLAALGLKEKDPTSPDVEPSVKTKVL